MEKVEEREGGREGGEVGEKGRGEREGRKGGEKGRGEREGRKGGEKGRGEREGRMATLEFEHDFYIPKLCAKNLYDEIIILTENLCCSCKVKVTDVSDHLLLDLKNVFFLI